MVERGNIPKRRRRAFNAGEASLASRAIVDRAMAGETISFDPNERTPLQLRADYPDAKPQTPKGWSQIGVHAELHSGVGYTGTFRKRMRDVTREDMTR